MQEDPNALREAEEEAHCQASQEAERLTAETETMFLAEELTRLRADEELRLKQQEDGEEEETSGTLAKGEARSKAQEDMDEYAPLDNSETTLDNYLQEAESGMESLFLVTEMRILSEEFPDSMHPSWSGAQEHSNPTITAKQETTTEDNSTERVADENMHPPGSHGENDDLDPDSNDNFPSRSMEVAHEIIGEKVPPQTTENSDVPRETTPAQEKAPNQTTPQKGTVVVEEVTSTTDDSHTLGGSKLPVPVSEPSATTAMLEDAPKETEDELQDSENINDASKAPLFGLGNSQLFGTQTDFGQDNEIAAPANVESVSSVEEVFALPENEIDEEKDKVAGWEASDTKKVLATSSPQTSCPESPLAEPNLGVADLVSKYSDDSFGESRGSFSNFHPDDLPRIGDIRAKFEESSKNSKGELVFGEAFRQKQRFAQLADKEQKKVAQMTLHGYTEMFVSGGPGKRFKGGAVGEVDTSNLEKTYSFQTEDEERDVHDGTCKIDFENERYRGMVFVVHDVRGMLVLNHFGAPENITTKAGGTRIPGGEIEKEEFLAAGKKTQYAKMQLQLAAREGAARHLYETTGIDMRNRLQRLTPAILQMNPPVDTKGTKTLRNEHEHALYYFLQVSDEDFAALDKNETPGDDTQDLTQPVGEVNSPLKLRLAGGYSDFTFIKDPLAAALELRENGDAGVTTALNMIMNQSIGQDGRPAKSASYQKGDELPVSRILEEKMEEEWIGTMTTLREDQNIRKKKKETDRSDGEADLTQKASTDSAMARQEVVTCCCGFWS